MYSNFEDGGYVVGTETEMVKYIELAVDPEGKYAYHFCK